MFSHFCLKSNKTKQNTQILTVSRFQCDAPRGVFWHTVCPPRSCATMTSRSGSCLSFPVLRTSLAGNLPSTRCGYCSPEAWHPALATEPGATWPGLPSCTSWYFQIKKLGSRPLLPMKKLEWFYTDFGKDSLRKTNADCHLIKQNKMHLYFLELFS